MFIAIGFFEPLAQPVVFGLQKARPNLEHYAPLGRAKNTYHTWFHFAWIHGILSSDKLKLCEVVMDYTIRPILPGEEHLLRDFLYEAIFVPKGTPAPPRSIIEQPELQVYIADFGKLKDDICLIAEVNKKAAGAVWVRVMNDYGHIDDDTPSFAIALYKEYRGFGLGSALMKEMLHTLKCRGYAQASLAVQKANYALKMYQRSGFEIVRETEEEYIMLCRLE